MAQTVSFTHVFHRNNGSQDVAVEIEAQVVEAFKNIKVSEISSMTVDGESLNESEIEDLTEEIGFDVLEEAAREAYETGEGTEDREMEELDINLAEELGYEIE
jgi:vacuolar-type H+-ATPase subunit C/Vma6